jgi:hypothetical protein
MIGIKFFRCDRQKTFKAVILDWDTEETMAETNLPYETSLESLDLEYDCEGDIGISSAFCSDVNTMLYTEMPEDHALRQEIEEYNSKGFTFKVGSSLQMVRHGNGATDREYTTYVISDVESENKKIGTIDNEKFNYFTAVEGKKDSYTRSKRRY